MYEDYNKHSSGQNFKITIKRSSLTSAHISEISWKRHQKYQHRENEKVKLQKKWKSPQSANCTWLVRVLVKLAENLVPPPQEVKSPQQEGRHLKIYELCRTPRKLWYLQSLFLPLPKKIKTSIDQSWSQNLMYQKFLQIHNPYPISSCGPSFQCHLKLFSRAFLSSRSFPGLTIQPKRSSTRGEILFGPIQIKECIL